MNDPSHAAAASDPYAISTLRMDIDRFIIPAVTLFIALLLFFFMLFASKAKSVGRTDRSKIVESAEGSSSDRLFPAESKIR